MVAPLLFVALGLTLGCGKKAPPASAVEPQAAPVVVTPEPASEPEPEAAPAAPAKPSENVSLRVTLTRADGSTHAGRVRLVERSTDWYAEQDWSADAGDIRLQLEGAGGETRVPWTDLKKVTVTLAKVSEASDCSYDSNYSPWMYDCTLRNKGTATVADGKSWEITDRFKWRLTWEDGSSEEFWLFKHPARQQDEATVGLDSEGENYDLYTALQDRLREELKTMVTGIVIQAQ